MRYTPKSELDMRLTKLQEKLLEQGVDGAIIVQNADLFYFTGTIQRSHLFVPAKGQPLLLVKKNLQRATEESSVDHIIGLDNMKELNNVLQSYGYGPFKTLGFELDVLPTAQYLRYKSLFQPAEIVDISPLIRIVRMIKSPYEIEIFREAAKIHVEVLDLIKVSIREGISELELTGIAANFTRAKGHPGYMRVRGFNQNLFYVHCLSGHNTNPSYFDGSVGGLGVTPAFAQGSSKKLLVKNESILLDFSFVLDGYMLDQTRVFCMGKLPAHLAEAHRLGVDILHEMEKMAVPGVPCSKLYERAMEMVEDSPYKKHFLGFPDQVTFIGHGVGVELDELPVIAGGFDLPIEKGMVFAMEPKFVFKDGAVGPENTYVVTESGLENLTVFDEDIIYV